MIVKTCAGLLAPTGQALKSFDCGVIWRAPEARMSARSWTAIASVAVSVSENVPDRRSNGRVVQRDLDVARGERREGDPLASVAR